MSISEDRTSHFANNISNTFKAEPTPCTDVLLYYLYNKFYYRPQTVCNPLRKHLAAWKRVSRIYNNL